MLDQSLNVLIFFFIGEITSKLIVSENNIICKCYTCDKNQIMSEL